MHHILHNNVGVAQRYLISLLACHQVLWGQSGRVGGMEPSRGSVPSYPSFAPGVGFLLQWGRTLLRLR